MSLLYIFTLQKAPLSCSLANLPKKGSLELALDALIISVFLVTVDRDAYKPGVVAKLFGVVHTQQCGSFVMDYVTSEEHWKHLTRLPFASTKP